MIFCSSVIVQSLHRIPCSQNIRAAILKVVTPQFGLLRVDAVFLSRSVDQVIRKGEVSCCWICTACKDNEFVQDEFTCKACELGWWPDEELEGRCTLHSPVHFCMD